MRAKKKNMKPQKTTVRPSADLDATDEFPVLDAAAYEAEVLSREPAEPSDGSAAATESDPSGVEPTAPDHGPPNAVPAVADSDVMLAVEHWIVQKTEELRGHHDALSLAQREGTAAAARAGELNRELAEANASLEALKGRERALAEALTGEQEAAQRRGAELDAADSHARGFTQGVKWAREHPALTAAEEVV